MDFCSRILSFMVFQLVMDFIIHILFFFVDNNYCREHVVFSHL
uniref:Uncharacterized protein n=1 Tax=Rhizophora mucronata TaxID=61149 RepID=A0A2P2N8F1_RHIMU